MQTRLRIRGGTSIVTTLSERFREKENGPPPSDSSISFGYVREFGMRYCPRDEEWHLFLCRLFKKFAWDRSKGISDYDMYCRAK